MRKTRDERGFTLVEMLVALGILVALMGVGFLAVQNYQRTLKQRELDETAREIFIAAQNHLTVAQSQGLLRKRSAGGSSDAMGLRKSRVVDGEEKSFRTFFVSSDDARLTSPSDTVLYDMLPALSLDDTVRLGGTYIIEYSLASATVTNVFYSDRSALSSLQAEGAAGAAQSFAQEDYERLFVTDGGYLGAEKKDARLAGYKNALVGWYGGDDVQSIARLRLYAPAVEVCNDECLWAKVSIPTNDVIRMARYGSEAGVQLRLIVKGETSGNERLAGTVPMGEFAASGGMELKGSSSHRYLTFVLDDVTAKGRHFHDLFCTGDRPLIPGENIDVHAEVMATNAFHNQASSSTQQENSLFADVDDKDDTNVVGKVGNFRHLVNMDARVSGYRRDSFGDGDGRPVGPTSFTQTTDMIWSDGNPSGKSFLSAIHANTARKRTYKTSDVPADLMPGGDEDKVQVYDLDGNPTKEGTYPPISPRAGGMPGGDASYALDYDGNEKTIYGVVIDTSGNAGLFATLDGAATVHDLRLSGFTVKTADGPSGAGAGALVGTTTGSVTIKNTLVTHDDKTRSRIESEAYAGGLAGRMTGSATVESCAATAWVSVSAGDASGAAAGGLVGCVGNGVEVKKSYAGGHTSNGAYLIDRPDVEASGNPGVLVAAGGLVGSMEGATRKCSITQCYSTASTWSTHTVGGLVGAAEKAAIGDAYATGLVSGSHQPQTWGGALVGVLGEGCSLARGAYAGPVNGELGAFGSASNATVVRAADVEDRAGDASFEPRTADARQYDATLPSVYAYQTIAQLARLGAADAEQEPDWVSTHYGDWQETGYANLSIENEERLVARLEVPTGRIGARGDLSLLVRGDNGAERYLVVSLERRPDNSYALAWAAESEVTTQAWLEDDGVISVASDAESGKTTLSFVLDDVTTAGRHFAELFAAAPADEAAFVPGENVTIAAEGGKRTKAHLESVAADTKRWVEVLSSDESRVLAAQTNSLFAEVAGTDDNRVARIANFRHLENVDPAVSGYARESFVDPDDGSPQGPVRFEQTRDLLWRGEDPAAFLDKIAQATSREPGQVQVYDLEGNATDAGTYAPVRFLPNTALEYDGKGRSIASVQVRAARSAGIFGTLPSGSKVHDLEIRDTGIATTSGCAGGLLGEAHGALTLSNVLVHDGSQAVASRVKAPDGAGGLVGLVASSGETVTVEGCAAAVYVETTGVGSVVGGLVGHATADAGGSVTIWGCYAGGHTRDGAYEVANSNVTAPSLGVAGGLVGNAEGVAVDTCYATCSASGGMAAGGLLGNVTGGSIRNSYATGLVRGVTNTGALVGLSNANNATALEGNRYFGLVNAGMAPVGGASADVAGVSAFDASVDAYNDFCRNSATAVPYDTALARTYAFQTVAQLGATVPDQHFVQTHHGDWPTPETLVVNTKRST